LILLPIDASHTTSYALSLNSNFCSRSHCLATLHTLQTTDKQTDVRRT